MAEPTAEERADTLAKMAQRCSGYSTPYHRTLAALNAHADAKLEAAAKACEDGQQDQCHVSCGAPDDTIGCTHEGRVDAAAVIRALKSDAS